MQCSAVHCVALTASAIHAPIMAMRGRCSCAFGGGGGRMRVDYLLSIR